MENGSHLYIPDVNRIFEPSFWIPFSLYFLAFQIIGYIVRHSFYKDYTGFKRYRLCNLTVCFIHSFISGTWAFIFLITHTYIFFFETLHWYQEWAVQLPILSMAYFCCDTIDMLRHEISRWTIELLLHHVASVFVFSCSVLPQKFLPYAYGALLMEVNSVFLHFRSLMQLTGANKTKPSLLSFVRFMNMFTFIIFRFGIQSWQITWAWIYRYRIHRFYVFIGIVGGSFFLIINAILFIRVLASDGFLGEFGRKHTAINRYTSF
uniref:TLC domain-containing protein n=1 Tax=Syphacia muris TaxID=451379 RepID=A0A0N5AJT9_9BILA